jgi:hypothetical protein
LLTVVGMCMDMISIMAANAGRNQLFPSCIIAGRCSYSRTFENDPLTVSNVSRDTKTGRLWTVSYPSFQKKLSGPLMGPGMGVHVRIDPSTLYDVGGNTYFLPTRTSRLPAPWEVGSPKARTPHPALQIRDAISSPLQLHFVQPYSDTYHSAPRLALQYWNSGIGTNIPDEVRNCAACRSQSDTAMAIPTMLQYCLCWSLQWGSCRPD